MRVDNEVIIPVKDSAHPLQRVCFTVEGGNSAEPVVIVSDANTFVELRRIVLSGGSGGGGTSTDVTALERRVSSLESSMAAIQAISDSDVDDTWGA